MSHSTTLSIALRLLAVVASTAPLLGHADPTSSKTLLRQTFAAREVQQIEIGDFHFLPGQQAPRHSHAAPVFGYVYKGTIHYQVEGQAPVVLKAGDVFYEPVGPQILHFDNASTTEEAAFVDINLEREGEPPIVFSAPPTERVDRRSLPSARLKDLRTKQMQVDEEQLAAGATATSRAAKETVVAYVSAGSVSVSMGQEPATVYGAGHVFYQPLGSATTQVKNASTTAPATLVRFRLNHDSAQ